MDRFPHCWPVEEFIKTYLKNKRAYARKQGYLVENTNKKQIRPDDKEEEEEEETEDWARGNGWGRDPTEDDDMYASDS